MVLVLLLLASPGSAMAVRPSDSDRAPHLDRYRGFQHIYANAAAMTGYRTRAFPESAVIVFDWLELRDSSGSVTEGPRRASTDSWATTGPGWRPPPRLSSASPAPTA